MLRTIFLLTLLSLLPRRVVFAWAPEARMPAREFGAFLDFDDMFDVRSPPNLGQVFLPTFNPLTHSHKMVAPLQARMPVREFGAFLDFDNMFDIRSPPNLGQVFLPTFNPLTRSHKMVAPLHTSSKAEMKHSQEPRNHLPGYSDPDMMQELHDANVLNDNHVMKLFFNKKNLLPDTADVFGRDESVDVRNKLDELEEDLDDFQPPTDDMVDVHTKRIFFEPRHKLPDKYYGSDL